RPGRPRVRARAPDGGEVPRPARHSQHAASASEACFAASSAISSLTEAPFAERTGSAPVPWLARSLRLCGYDRSPTEVAMHDIDRVQLEAGEFEAGLGESGESEQGG